MGHIDTKRYIEALVCGIRILTQSSKCEGTSEALVQLVYTPFAMQRKTNKLDTQCPKIMGYARTTTSVTSGTLAMV